MSPRADTSTGTAPSTGSPVGSSAAGACSRMTCALVPPSPNDDTPARRGLPVDGQSTCSLRSSIAPAVQSTWDDGTSACRVRGTTPCSIALTSLITLATPEAICVWPMFDLIDPSSRGRSRSWP